MELIFVVHELVLNMQRERFVPSRGKETAEVVGVALHPRGTGGEVLQPAGTPLTPTIDVSRAEKEVIIRMTAPNRVGGEVEMMLVQADVEGRRRAPGLVLVVHTDDAATVEARRDHEIVPQGAAFPAMTRVEASLSVNILCW